MNNYGTNDSGLKLLWQEEPDIDTFCVVTLALRNSPAKQVSPRFVLETKKEYKAILMATTAGYVEGGITPPHPFNRQRQTGTHTQHDNGRRYEYGHVLLYNDK